MNEEDIDYEEDRSLVFRIREAMMHPVPNYLYATLQKMLPEIGALERHTKDLEFWVSELKKNL